MAGHFNLGNLLVEKEKEVRRQRVVDAYTFVAGSFCLSAAFYSTVAYLALPLPAQGRDKAPLAVYKSIAWPIKGDTALNDPDSGVQLLISIFKRVGGNQQIAANEDKKQLLASNNLPQTSWFKKIRVEKAEEDENAYEAKRSAQQFNKELVSHAAPDPALSIRPQFSKARLDDNYSGQSQGQLPNASYGSNMAANMAGGKVVSEKPYIREWYKGAKQLQLADNLPVVQDRRIVAADDQTLGSGGASTTASNLNNSNSQSSADNVSGIIRPSEQPGLFKYVREYMKDAQPQMASNNFEKSLAQSPAQSQMASGAPASAPALAGATNGTIASNNSGKLRFTPAPASQDSFNSLGGGSDAESATRSMTKMSYATKSASVARGRMQAVDALALDADKITIKTKKAVPTRIAFLPPNAVHGIAGLPLGSSIAEARAFFKTRGKTTVAQISGFQVMTLRDNEGVPLLQAYLREGTVEALRIFHSGYTPPQLGLSLGETLPTMKAKFGEPAFILEEPRSKISADARGPSAPNVVAKNYCYPVSQVSFQLARTDNSTPPQVMSVMVFRFL